MKYLWMIAAIPLLIFAAGEGKITNVETNSDGFLVERTYPLSTDASKIAVYNDDGSIGGSDGISMDKLKVKSGGIESFGRAKFKSADVQMLDPNRGLILTVTNSYGTSSWYTVVYQTTESDATLELVKVSSSPEIPFEERVQRTVDKINQKKKAKADFDKAGNLQAKIDAIAEFVGLKEQE